MSFHKHWVGSFKLLFGNWTHWWIDQHSSENVRHWRSLAESVAVHMNGAFQYPHRSIEIQPESLRGPASLRVERVGRVARVAAKAENLPTSDQVVILQSTAATAARLSRLTQSNWHLTEFSGTRSGQSIELANEFIRSTPRPRAATAMGGGWAIERNGAKSKNMEESAPAEMWRPLAQLGNCLRKRNGTGSRSFGLHQSN